MRGGGLFNSAATCNVPNLSWQATRTRQASCRICAEPSLCTVTDSQLAGGKYSDYTDGGGNILNTDPLIGPLADNGGWGVIYPCTPNLQSSN